MICNEGGKEGGSGNKKKGREKAKKQHYNSYDTDLPLEKKTKQKASDGVLG